MADGVRGRVQVYTTHYRGGVSFINGFESRGWITIDGRPIVNMHRFFHDGFDGGEHNGERFDHGAFNSWDLKTRRRSS